MSVLCLLRAVAGGGPVVRSKTHKHSIAGFFETDLLVKIRVSPDAGIQTTQHRIEPQKPQKAESFDVTIFEHIPTHASATYIIIRVNTRVE